MSISRPIQYTVCSGQGLFVALFGGGGPSISARKQCYEVFSVVVKMTLLRNTSLSFPIGVT